MSEEVGRKGRPGIEAVGATHIGQRKLNEDSLYHDRELGLILVADGVGGHQAGDVASTLACEVIAREAAGGASLDRAVRCANRGIIAAVQGAQKREGMATTVVAALFRGSDYELAWVGDSRAYLWDGRLKLLSRDHSQVQEMVERGQVSVEQARIHPRKNVILQALGMQSDDALRVGVNRGRLAAGELLLLCSDGLSDVIDSAGLAGILTRFADGARAADLQAAVDALVTAAVEAGGRDNITAALVAAREGEGATVGEQADCLWSFDPVSGDYSGLPEPEPQASILTAGSGPIAPRGADETLLMPADTRDRAGDAQADGNAAQTGAVPAARSGKKRLVLWLLLAAALAWGLFYSLGIEGIG